jgi:16S rRNA (uracil1498-N3)-methyltransferase
MVHFNHFLEQPIQGRKYIAHCYEEVPRVELFDELRKPSDSQDATVLVGPEGDFSIDEVKAAVAAGWVSVSLGSARLRTETAGLAAVMMMQLAQK